MLQSYGMYLVSWFI